MTTLPTSGGFNLAKLLAIAGGALSSRAGGGTFSQGAQQGLMGYDARQDAERVRQMEEQQYALAQEEAEAKRTENQRKVENWKNLEAILGGNQMAGVPMLPNNGRPGGMAPQVQTAASQSPFGDIPENVRRAILLAGPDKGPDMLAEYFMTPPKEKDPFKPNVEEFYVGGKKVKGYLDENRNLVTVGDEVPLYKPEGQGIQIDTNGDGIPDVTIGGKGMKPLPDAASQQTLRAELIEQGLKDIEGINFDNVSPTKAATGSWLSSMNPLAEAFAQGVVLNDDEKKLIGAQAKIQEAVISAITGAAYNEEQKNNMRAAYVIQATDSPTRKLEKTKGAARFLRQLDKNSGYNRLIEAPEGGSNPKAVGDMSDDEILKGLGVGQ